MSGIEALSSFFENIRPRYSWSSTDSTELDCAARRDASTFPHEEPSTAPSSLPSPMIDDDYTELQGQSRSHVDERNAIVHDNSEDVNYCSQDVQPDTSTTTQESPFNNAVAGPSFVNASENSAFHDMSPRIRETNPFHVNIESTPSPAIHDAAIPTHPASSFGHPLPEDDGYRQLREKVMDIQRMNVSEKERAQRMHDLMNRRYLAFHTDTHQRSVSPVSPLPDGPDLAKVTQDDIEPTYHDKALGILGCSHYRRSVKLQCSSCLLWYPCRFCHDEVENHVLVRKQTKQMLCMCCGKAQPAQQSCRFCGKCAARYYCDKCKLWDDDPKKTIYHCSDCGICRIGLGLGKDFFHCRKCGVCMSIELEGQHRCIERSTDCDCPICGEYMFTSIKTVVFMNCGHSIHHSCYNEHMKTSYRCPTCARSVLNMETQFRFLDHEIARQPLPEPYKNWHCVISCNDCFAKSDVPFHFLGLKCSNCKSYNTCEVRLIRPEEDCSDAIVRDPPIPAHLMPHPDMAVTILANRTAGLGAPTDLASVMREINMTSGNDPRTQAYMQPPIAAGLVEQEEDDDTESCESCNIDDDNLAHDKGGSFHNGSGPEKDDQDEFSDDEYDDENDDDDDDNEHEDHDQDDDEEEDIGGYEIIHLPFHP